MRWRPCLVILFIFSAQLGACADFARWLRQYTYPPDFRYIERDQLRTVMGQLAAHVREISQHIHSPADADQHRKDIIEHLTGMESAIQTLDKSGWPSNHPLIDKNLPRFRQDLRQARLAVERDPPNYLLTHEVVGACVYCHGAH
jgi:hypothetical protein